MAKGHSTAHARIAAVGYLRRSTNRQEKSLPDQRKEIERYADQHGYSIIRWFQDDAISGDATEKRAGFLALHKAACNGRDFDFILVWDQDRFGRFDSMEAGYWIHPLRRAGVGLVSVTEGPIDWSDFTGRVMYSIKQEGKHQFLRDLSRNVTRGQITNAEKGHLCGQAAPYGFDRMLINERGEHAQRVHNGEQVAKPRSWHVTLVESDDAAKVRTLKWLFAQYATNTVGLRSLADQLNTRGVPGPAGGLWHLGTIREILRNEAYTGDFVWAKRRIGKYHRVAGGEIKERSTSERGSDGEPLTKRNPQAEWIVKKDAHAALIDRATFARVQAKLTARKGQTGPKSKNAGGYVLSGIVHCAHCGAKMYGTRLSVKRGGKSYEYHKYICSTYHTKGRNQCGYNNVRQDELLPFLRRMLRDTVLCGGHRDELAQRVRKRLEAHQQAADPKELAAIEAKLVKLDGEIEHGTKRLLRAPDEVADLLGAELARLRRDRERLANELESQQAHVPADIEADVTAAVDRLWQIADELDKADPAKLRELIHRMVARIDLYFDAKPTGARMERPLAKGCIDLRPDPIFKHVSRGDRI